MRPGSVRLSAATVTSTLPAFAAWLVSPSGTSATTHSPPGLPISTSGSPPSCTVAPAAAFTPTTTPSTGARFAQLHFSFEPLDLEDDAPLYHLGLPGEHLLLEPYFQARLAQRSSYAHGVRTCDCE